jgi:protein-tyrosine phosphatase
MPTVLFLCSGNYYRSRFAEILFNHLAAERDLDWEAVSRGLATSDRNPGPISAETILGLRARGLAIASPRYPLALTETDLTRADRVIALYESEHRPLLHTLFPEWVHRVEYWQVPDLGEMEAVEALDRIERNVKSLVECLERVTIV